MADMTTPRTRWRRYRTWLHETSDPGYINPRLAFSTMPLFVVVGLLAAYAVRAPLLAFFFAVPSGVMAGVVLAIGEATVAEIKLALRRPARER